MMDRANAALDSAYAALDSAYAAYNAKMDELLNKSKVSNIHPGQCETNDVKFRGEPVFQSLRIDKTTGERYIVVNCTKLNALLVMGRDLTIQELLQFD